MCEAPSTWRASTCSIVPVRRIAAEKGLIAAPGTPKGCVTPSRSRMATAASAAVMRAMSALLCGVAAVRPGTGQFGDELQQAGVVEAAVAAGDQRAHQLGDHRAERDRDPCLAGGRRDDA